MVHHWRIIPFRIRSIPFVVVRIVCSGLHWSSSLWQICVGYVLTLETHTSIVRPILFCVCPWFWNSLLPWKLKPTKDTLQFLIWDRILKIIQKFHINYWDKYWNAFFYYSQFTYSTFKYTTSDFYLKVRFHIYFV